MSAQLPPIGPTTNAHFEAIGRVAYEWSNVEMVAQNLVAALAGIPNETALIVTNSGNLKSWMEIIRRLAFPHCSPELYKDCKRLTEKIDTDLLRDRNTIIHGLWNTPWEEIFGTRMQPPADLKSNVTGFKKIGAMRVDKEFDAAEVRAIADNINNARRELEWMSVRLIDALRNKPP